MGATGNFAQEVDAVTLERARRGDMRAHARLYQDFGHACFNLALRIVGSRAAAEDVVQDVFLKMMDAIRGYRGAAPFGAWLKRMTANAAIDHLRQLRHQDDSDPEALFAELPGNAGVAPAQAHDAWTLLQRLPPRARAVVVLHEMEGYTHKELSELFGQTESYSKSILARSLQRLHEWLGSDGDQETHDEHVNAYAAR